MAIFNKARFVQAYQMAMAQQAPRMYKDLMKAETLKEKLQEMGDEAQAMYDHQVRFLMGTHKMDKGQSEMMATEQVFAELIQFPQE